MSWIPFSFLPDDPELWDISLESTDLKVTGAKMSEPSPAAHQAPETPRGHHQMGTRSRTPHRMNQHKAPARLAQPQPPAAASSTGCASQHTPGACCHKGELCLHKGSWYGGKVRWEKHSFLLDLAADAVTGGLENCLLFSILLSYQGRVRKRIEEHI